MLGYCLMNLLESYKSSYFIVKMSSLTPSRFGYYKSKKLAEKCLNIYKLMMKESSLAWHLKAFTMREISILATWLCMYIERMV